MGFFVHHTITGPPLRAIKHAYVSLMPQFPDSAVKNWSRGGHRRRRCSGSAGAGEGAAAGADVGANAHASSCVGAIERGGPIVFGVGAGAGTGTGAAAGSKVNTHSGVGVRFRVPPSDARVGGISDSHVWCRVTSRVYTTIPNMTFVTL